MSQSWDDKVRVSANRRLIEWMEKSSELMEELWDGAKTTEQRLQMMETHGQLAERLGMLSRHDIDDLKRPRNKKKNEMRVVRRPFAG